jgi:hypothetical protein
MASEHGDDPLRSEVELAPFYLNVLLLNKDQIVERSIGAKVGLGLFGKGLSGLASHVVSDETVLNQVVIELISKVKDATAAMGVTCLLEQCFQKGAFVVLKIKVERINLIDLILATKGQEYAGNFTKLLSSLHSLGLAETALPKIWEKVTNLVETRLMEQMQERIPLQLIEKGVQCKVDVVSAADQAGFFFDAINK